MVPINFPEANCEMKGDHIEIGGQRVGNLRVYNGHGQFVSKWKMSWRERMHALFFGTCWLAIHTYSFPPVAITAKPTIFINEETNNNEKETH